MYKRQIVGGRASAYERVMDEGKKIAEAELVQKAMAMGANAIIGIDFDYEVMGKGGSMLMVSMTGTAVIVDEQTYV